MVVVEGRALLLGKKVRWVKENLAEILGNEAKESKPRMKMILMGFGNVIRIELITMQSNPCKSSSSSLVKK